MLRLCRHSGIVHRVAVKVLRLVEAVGASIDETTELCRRGAVLADHFKFHFPVNQLARLIACEVRTCATHGAFALLHLHHALLHSSREVLAGLAHIHLGRRHLLNDAL